MITSTAAATTAGVTIPTIRTWCRIGAVTATKTAGRWVIDEASLARRIAIGAKATGEVRTDHAGRYVVVGPHAALEQALRTGAAVRITAGPCDGDTVHLGLRGTTYSDYGISLETVGLVRRLANGKAAYAIDTRRFERAPRLAAIQDAAQEEADRREIAAAAADRAYLYPDYE